MRDRSRKAGVAVLLAALGMTLPSCGSSGGGGGTGPSTPVRTVIGTRTFSLGVPDAAAVDATITGSGTGTLDATANWTFSSNDVDIYVTNTSCTDASSLLAGACAFLAKADSSSAKPERVTLSVSAGSVYRVWVANFGPGSESGTLEIGLTR